MRRTYYVAVQVMKTANEGGPIGTTRARYGIFCTNDWMAKARIVLRNMGYHPDFNQFDREDDQDTLAYAYGSYSKDGVGRSGSSILKIYCKRQNAQEGK